MATITVGVSGSSIVNGTKTYTISDADLQLLLNWAAATYFPGGSPTNTQTLLAWVQGFINSTITSVQAHGTRAPLPPPITIS